MSKPLAQIPVIDISPSNTHAATQLLDAATNNGFVYISNNTASGISPADIDQMFNLSKQFFKGPVENKRLCPTRENRGWVSMQQEMLDPGNQKKGDFKEAFNLGAFTNNKPNQPLPLPLSTNINTLAGFNTSCHTLCTRILQLFAEALEIPSDWFSSRHDQSQGCSGSILRLLYYPALKDDVAKEKEDIRAGAHSDYGSITLLFQRPGQPGLEIKTTNGTWEAVPINPLQHDPTDSTSPLPILVNIGDLLAYWTNGLLKSTVHRVVFPKGEESKSEDRYSMAYFCHPLDDAELIAVPSKRVQQYVGNVGNGKQMGGKILTAKDHLLERLAATYGGAKA